MTADQRLDQLEPLVAQTLAVADCHTAQLKQLVNIATQHTGILTQQSDNMQFALQSILELKELVQSLNRTQQGMDTKLESMSNKLQGVEDKQQGINAKLDQILGLLDRNGKQG